jgi:hypothetical protein
MLSEFKVGPGVTVMVSAVNAADLGAAAGVGGKIGAVRGLERELKAAEEEISAVEARLERIRLGFHDADGTAVVGGRVRRDAQQLEERVLRLVLSSDALAAEPGECGGAEARWRAARKAFVERSQKALRRCDGVVGNVEEICADEFGETARRRGGRKTWRTWVFSGIWFDAGGSVARLAVWVALVPADIFRV